MNTDSPTRALDAPRPIRDIIVDARKSSGRTEKQVNREFRRHMAEAEREAPKSIMTKVRDKRRVFSLDEVEARCLALALDIDPVVLIRDASGSAPGQDAASAPDAADETVETDRTPHTDPGPRVEETGTQKEDVLPVRTYGAPGVSFFEVRGSLQIAIDMDLDATQFDRLTLAVPAYMMRIQRAGGVIRCQARVPIFPYQAELIMRAIYGGR